jgi:hypothetical protein
MDLGPIQYLLDQVLLLYQTKNPSILRKTLIIRWNQVRLLLTTTRVPFYNQWYQREWFRPKCMEVGRFQAVFRTFFSMTQLNQPQNHSQITDTNRNFGLSKWFCNSNNLRNPHTPYPNSQQLRIPFLLNKCNIQRVEMVDIEIYLRET